MLKLQASLIFLSGRTCTIGGWLNTFLPHCIYIYIYIYINTAALHCSYEHGGKRKRKCHLKFSEEGSLQIHVHINPLPPIHYLYFLPIFRALWTVTSLPAKVFSLFVFPVLRSVCVYLLICDLFLRCKAEFSASLLLSSVSHDLKKSFQYADLLLREHFLFLSTLKTVMLPSIFW